MMPEIPFEYNFGSAGETLQFQPLHPVAPAGPIQFGTAGVISFAMMC